MQAAGGKQELPAVILTLHTKEKDTGAYHRVKRAKPASHESKEPKQVANR